MIKLPKYITLAALLLICVAFFVVNHILSQNSNPTSLWQYQCIDTMKTSRDAARSDGFKQVASQEIAKELGIIKKLGANCVAIDTPYDEEFMSFLQLWVTQARKEHLHIWFRGNFSSWEGWFNYPKGMTTQEHLQRTKKFILSHPDLFQNGDIFTPAMEAENGWGAGYVPPNEYPLFRKFLVDEHTTAQEAFQEVGKNVITNWLSMSGGLAKNLLDEATIKALDNTVTIDHYVNDPEDMKNYVDYFSTKFHAQVVIGEFGAPIPDINGEMTDQEQANFVKNIFYILYQEHDAIFAVNYWTLNYSSTALVDTNDTARPVVNIVNQYYHPMIITGKITDELGDAVDEVKISINNGENATSTNSSGYYTLLTPGTPVQLVAFKKEYTQQAIAFSLLPQAQVQKNIVLKPLHPTMFYEIRLHIKRFFDSLLPTNKKK